MSKAAILGSIRRSLRRGESDGAAARARLAERPRGLIPERSRVPRPHQVDLFQSQAEGVETTVVRLSGMEEVPGAVADYLKRHNLPGDLRVSPDPALTGLDWAAGAPMLSVAPGKADPQDTTSLTLAVAGIAETGTLMLESGSAGPTTLNFLPENHLVVLRASQVVGAYEEAWSALRARHGEGAMPRTVNFVTGPSRTGDIEQQIQLGAHGPRRLHVLLIEDDPEAKAAPPATDATAPAPAETAKAPAAKAPSATPAAKKAAPKKTAPKKTATKKTGTTISAPKKTAATKTASKKTSAKKTAAKSAGDGAD